MLYFDCDGVLRDLFTYTMGIEQKDWNEKVNGKDFFETIEEDRTILNKCHETQYLPIIVSMCPEVNILSSQPVQWREYTNKWIDDKIKPFCKCNIQYVSKPFEKMKHLKDGDMLVEDYPFFEDYSKIVLIDHLYNRKLEKAKNEPIIRINDKDQMRKFLVGMY